MKSLVAALGILCFSLSSSFAGAAGLVLYSGRAKSLIEPLLEDFEKETGIDVETRWGDSAELAIALREEGKASPADVFLAQDPGALGAVSDAGLFRELPESLREAVLPRFRPKSGDWLPASGRARVLAYSPERVNGELPGSVFDLTAPRWKGRVGWAPTNGSFQAFVSAMRAQVGEEKTREWLRAMKANGARPYPKNAPILEAIAAGEIDVGLPNHYYLFRFREQDPDFPVRQTTFDAGDVGNLVSLAGAGILKTAKHPDAARAFLEFLVTPEAQRFFTQHDYEYAVIDGIELQDGLLPPADLAREAPDVDLNRLADLEETLRLLRDVGLL